MYLTNIRPGTHVARKLALLLGIVLITGGGIGAVVAQSPLMAVGIVVVILLTGTIIAWPDAPTLAVLFILYTNAAVIAVQFHRVPLIIGASVPLLLIIPLANYLIFHRQRIIFHPLLILLFLFLVVQMFGVAYSIKVKEGLANLITYLTEGLGLFFLITNTVRTTVLLRWSVWTLLIAGGLIGILTFYQQVTQTFDNNYGGFAQVSDAAFKTGETELQGEVEQPRLAGPIGEQNRFAQTMLMLVPLGLFQLRGQRSYWQRMLVIIATGFTALGVILTFSRGAAVGFILVIIIMVFLGYIKPAQIVILGVGLSLLLFTVPEYTRRLTSLEVLSGLADSEDTSALAEADGSTQSRLTEMGAAVLAFADHPLIGVGPGLFKYHYSDYAQEIGLRVHQGNRQAHSLFPSIAADTGGLGLLCFLGICYMTLRDLVRTRKRWIDERPEIANMATGFILAIFSYLMTGLFLHFAYIRFFWIIMALAAMASYTATAEVPENQHYTSPINLLKDK